jgi:hypothetical protein
MFCVDTPPNRWYYKYVNKNNTKNKKEEIIMTKEMEVYVADGTTPISEGFATLEELIEFVTAEQTFNFIDYVWEDGTTGRLTRGIDY